MIFGWPVIVRSTSTRQSPRISVESYSGSYSGSERAGQLDFPYGAQDDLTLGPEGPTLNDTCVLKLNLKPSEAMEMNRILQTAYVRYLELEAQYTQQLPDGNSLKVTKVKRMNIKQGISNFHCKVSCGEACYSTFDILFSNFSSL